MRTKLFKVTMCDNTTVPQYRSYHTIKIFKNHNRLSDDIQTCIKPPLIPLVKAELEGGWRSKQNIQGQDASKPGFIRVRKVWVEDCHIREIPTRRIPCAPEELQYHHRGSSNHVGVSKNQLSTYDVTWRSSDKLASQNSVTKILLEVNPGAFTSVLPPDWCPVQAKAHSAMSNT